jgi:aerobic-type carbon monoxide dehydrogenase small subunit (CoxS/CutS family)
MAVIELTVNGARRRGPADDRMTLADFLREGLGLTGTHLGCEHGVCGACTVLVDGRSTRSCLMFAAQATGRTVQTIEGLAPAGELTTLQQAMRDVHAFQCGFCTPGFLMTIRELLDDEACADLDRAGIREYLGGNICRCSGYQTIIDGVELARSREAAERGGGGE